MAAVVDTEKCSACGDCVEACPLDALSVPEKVAVVDESACGDCGACVDACPNGAITVG